jgi:hypothetical protein
VQYRHALGLPACSVSLKPITEIGRLGVLVVAMTSHVHPNCLYTTEKLGLLRLVEGVFSKAPEYTGNWRAYDPLADAQIATCLDPM